MIAANQNSANLENNFAEIRDSMKEIIRESMKELLKELKCSMDEEFNQLKKKFGDLRVSSQKTLTMISELKTTLPDDENDDNSDPVVPEVNDRNVVHTKIGALNPQIHQVFNQLNHPKVNSLLIHDFSSSKLVASTVERMFNESPERDGYTPTLSPKPHNECGSSSCIPITMRFRAAPAFSIVNPWMIPPIFDPGGETCMSFSQIIHDEYEFSLVVIDEMESFALIFDPGGGMAEQAYTVTFDSITIGEEKVSTVFPEIAISISMGTRQCNVAFWNGSQVQLLRNTRNQKIMRTYVTFKDEVLLGGASNQPSHEYEGLSGAAIFNIRCLIGRVDTGLDVHASKSLSSLVQTLDIGVRPLFATLVNNMWRSTTSEEVQLKHPMRNIALTIPVSFSQFQLTQIERACAMVGLHVLRVMPEPTVVALLYAQQQQQTIHKNRGSGSEKIALIFNIGVGYSDVDIRVTAGVSQIKALAGSTIGGENILQNMMCYLLPNMDSLFSTHGINEIKSLGLFRVATQDVIHKLSFQDTVQIDVDLGNGTKISKIVDKKEFERVNQVVFEQCEKFSYDNIKFHNEIFSKDWCFPKSLQRAIYLAKLQEWWHTGKLFIKCYASTQVVSFGSPINKLATPEIKNEALVDLLHDVLHYKALNTWILCQITSKCLNTGTGKTWSCEIGLKDKIQWVEGSFFTQKQHRSRLFPEEDISLAFSIFNEFVQELRSKPCPLVLAVFFRWFKSLLV